MDIYKECPIWEDDLLLMRRMRREDAENALFIYQDKESRRLFNMDNFTVPCFFETKEEMEKEIDFYERSYQHREFARWSVFLKSEQRLIASVECFARESDGVFPSAAILRMDVLSRYEAEIVIKHITALMLQHVQEAFGVDMIATKVVKEAYVRRTVLQGLGFRESEIQPIDHHGKSLKDYQICKI